MDGRPGVGLVPLDPGHPVTHTEPPRLLEGRQIFHHRVRLFAGGQARPHRIKSGCVAIVRGPTLIEIKISEHTEPRVPEKTVDIFPPTAGPSPPGKSFLRATGRQSAEKYQ